MVPLVVIVALLVLVGGLVGVVAGWFLGRSAARREGATVQVALDTVRQERGELLQGAVDTVLSVASSSLGQQMEAGRFVLDRERQAVAQQVEGVQGELAQLNALVGQLQKERAHQTGQLTTRLDHAVSITTSLAETTRSLEQALASPKARGQWGERMAEDVLRAAGFVEGINYAKQKKLSTGGIPDFTFDLPRGHVVHMDVKFPIDNYLRWLDGADDPDRERYAKRFQRDVRQRIKELTERAYVDPETTVDYLLLFVPNESVYGFLHEQDPLIVDHAIGQKVVLCSPTTLFAVLAVIRQSVDNFLVERRSDEILGALGSLREQWERWAEPMDKMGRGLASAQKAFDELSGRHTREFTRRLDKLEGFRDARSAPDHDDRGAGDGEHPPDPDSSSDSAGSEDPAARPGGDERSEPPIPPAALRRVI